MTRKEEGDMTIINKNAYLSWKNEVEQSLERE